MRRLIIDTQLLVLFVVGSASPAYIAQHKRLGAYSEQDFDLLLDVVGQYGEIVFTPNTLTEASNLLAQTHEPLRSKLFEVFRALIDEVHEDYVESRTASAGNVFLRLGLADAVLLVSDDVDQVLLTADLDLYLAAVAAKRSAVNFNHLRQGF
jgi:hypothetical protein